MKKSKKVLLISLSVALALLVAVVAVSAFTMTKESTEILKYIAGVSEECPENADVNGDGKVNVLDVIAMIREQQTASVRLETLTLDDENYTFDFNKDRFSYTVKLPDGRPPIPRVEATAAEGVEIEIIQAYIPDGKDSGSAKITVSDSKGTNVYTVKFVRDAACGFVLQYDDRYEFKPAGNGEGVVFESSNSEVASVDEKGLVHAKKVSAEAVTLTAKVDGQIVDTLVIDRVEKAHVNLFLVTGQSNAQGCYSNTTMRDPALLEAQLSNVEAIGQFGRVYSYDFHPITNNTEAYELRYTLYDMNSIRKQGFQNSLGKTWYDLSGEKVVFLQTAYSGAPIQSWLDPDRHEEAGTYTSAKRNYYDDTQTAYADLMPLLEDNYEIIRTANFWNQGGTAMGSVYDKASSGYVDPKDPSELMTDDEYYRLFMLMYEDMKADFGVELWGVFLNRVIPAATSEENKALQSHSDMVPIRSAQYALHNYVADLSLVSRVGDYAKRDTWSVTTDSGYGFVDSDNVHFTQIGHNERGRVAAANAFAIWFDTTEAASVEIVAENGRDRLTSADTITIELGEEYRLAGYALPEASGEKTILTSSDTSIVKVDKYGVVRGVAEGNAVITATTESGKTQTVNVEITRPEVVKVITEATTYRWDFNDLTATGKKNDLTVSACSEYYGADENYTLKDGIYSVSADYKSNSNNVYTNRPDFELEKPINLTSRASWTIEWRGLMHTYGVLFGQSQTDPTSSTSTYPFIYNYYSNKYSDKYGYPLKICLSSSDSKCIFLDFGDYRNLNKEMNTWRLGYDVNASTMSLYYYNETTSEWEVVDSVEVGAFDMTFTSIFGRAKGNGAYGYCGDMDYVQVDFMQEYEVKADTNYLWEFDDLTSSVDKNDLTLADYSESLGAGENYTLNGGVYSVGSAGANSAGQPKRPAFEMENPVTFTSETSWVIEWRGKINTSCVLLGPEQLTPEVTSTSTYPFIYLYVSSTVYNVNKEPFGYPVKFAFSSKDADNFLLNYGDYRASAKSTNSWRIAYNSETGIISLYFLNSDTRVWEVVDAITVGDFSMTFTTLFGGVRGNGYLGYYGDMDYVQIIIED